MREDIFQKLRSIDPSGAALMDQRTVRRLKQEVENTLPTLNYYGRMVLEEEARIRGIK